MTTQTRVVNFTFSQTGSFTDKWQTGRTALLAWHWTLQVILYRNVLKQTLPDIYLITELFLITWLVFLILCYTSVNDIPVKVLKRIFLPLACAQMIVLVSAPALVYRLAAWLGGIHSRTVWQLSYADWIITPLLILLLIITSTVYLAVLIPNPKTPATGTGSALETVLYLTGIILGLLCAGIFTVTPLQYLLGIYLATWVLIGLQIRVPRIVNATLLCTSLAYVILFPNLDKALTLMSVRKLLPDQKIVNIETVRNNLSNRLLSLSGSDDTARILQNRILHQDVSSQARQMYFLHDYPARLADGDKTLFLGNELNSIPILRARDEYTTLISDRDLYASQIRPGNGSRKDDQVYLTSRSILQVLPLLNGPYDLIVQNQALREFIAGGSDPDESLDRIRGLLTEDGIYIIPLSRQMLSGRPGAAWMHRLRDEFEHGFILSHRRSDTYYLGSLNLARFDEFQIKQQLRPEFREGIKLIKHHQVPQYLEDKYFPE